MKKSGGGGAASRSLEESKPETPAGADFNAEDPSSSLMKMMQNLYETGDDDMKRTISESFAKAKSGQPIPGAPGTGAAA